MRAEATPRNGVASGLRMYSARILLLLFISAHDRLFEGYTVNLGSNESGNKEYLLVTKTSYRIDCFC